jgi:hypothetical protein
VDGGTIRLRTPKEEKSIWRDYKAIATDQGILATLHDNPPLIALINSQLLSTPITCLGDGHPGVWNIIAKIATPTQRREILDWYHLTENLYKVGGSLKRLDKAKALLWQGKINETLILFRAMKCPQAASFCTYLEQHRHRIINYAYYKAEGISIGSGAVESAIKQIDRRTQISGAQWKTENGKRPTSPCPQDSLHQWIIIPKRMKCSR